MATQTRTPTSDESNTGGFTTSPLFSKVNDSSDATLIVGVTNGGGRATFGFSAFTLPAASVITNLTINYRARSTTTSTAANRCSSIKVGGTYYGISDTTTNADTGGIPSASNAAIGAYSFVYTINPKTGQAWTAAEINGTDPTNPLQAFGVCGNDFNPDVNFYDVSATVTYSVAYNLTADSGSFSQTGLAVALLFAHILGAASGSFAANGQDAGLSKGKLMSVDGGSLVVSGQGVGFGFNRVIPANSGTYALTGEDLALINNKRLAADNGSYSVSGQDAAILNSQRIVCDAGIFAVTGQDATLSVQQAGNYSMPADNGSVSISGSAGLIKQSIIVGGQGSYVITGIDAGFSIGASSGNISAEPGSYSVAGVDVQFTHTRRRQPKIIDKILYRNRTYSR